MDPNACLIEIIDAAAAGDYEMLEMRAAALSEWLKGGGFEPDLAYALQGYINTNGLDW